MDNKLDIVNKYKKHKKYCMYAALIILILVISFYFNNKINRVSIEIKDKFKALSNQTSNPNSTSSAKIKYNDLLTYQEKYDAKKQYFDYNSSQIKLLDEALLDKDGIVLRKIGGELVYNPVSIAQYGLIAYGLYIETGDNGYLEKAKKQADYLLEIQNQEDGGFYYNFDFKVAGTNETMKSPWISAMAQGQVISLLARLYHITNEDIYLSGAIKSMLPLTKKVSEGGLCASLFGYDYYEEYPTSIPSYTLNGFMFTLIGLHDLYEITQNIQAKELYDKGIETIEFCLPLYDNNKNISLYHLGYLFDKGVNEHFAENYHRIHIIQLRILNQFENSEIIKFYADRWENYVKVNKQ